MQTRVKVTANMKQITVEGKGSKVLAALGAAFLFTDEVPDDELLSAIGKRELFMFPSSSFELVIAEELKIEANIRKGEIKNIIAAIFNDVDISKEVFVDLFYSTREIMTTAFKNEFKDKAKRLRVLQMLLTELGKGLKEKE